MNIELQALIIYLTWGSSLAIFSSTFDAFFRAPDAKSAWYILNNNSI